ncbi:hypothetical protein RJ640_028071 [Escallonia rubra]|uniref:F-box domain-containing protein n=1 Tax=Escallonia rubra TaxID=112253 RepID=A0AA88QYP1_9ASTE|nr:hypothetical protein RJ640_028071 [Escallonia rubra]
MSFDLSYGAICGDSMISSTKICAGFSKEERPDKIFYGGGDWNIDCGLRESCDYRKENNERVSDDAVDVLPSDPFGMEIGATFTSMTGWIDGIEKGFGLENDGKDETEVKVGADQLFTRLNLVLNGAMRFYPAVGESKTDGKSVVSPMDKEFLDGLYDGSFLVSCNVEELMGPRQEKFGDFASGYPECTKGYGIDDGGAPHDAMFFAFSYLGLKDLLSVERVCKSFRDMVQNDTLLWKSIQIERPLSDRVTDDVLVRLTSRAQGSLQCLNLVECLKISDSGLQRVLECNPGLAKLSVPGCVRLSIGGILFNLKVLKSGGRLGLKHLRIGGLSGVTEKYYQELKFLLGADSHKKLSIHKPRFYHEGQLYLSLDDDRAIDIETCPRCQEIRQVYDCPADSCKKHATQLCRACTVCISRCVGCGCCINDSEYEETFCLEMLCFNCVKQLFSCQGRHQQASYHICLYG